MKLLSANWHRNTRCLLPAVRIFTVTTSRILILAVAPANSGSGYASGEPEISSSAAAVISVCPRTAEITATPATPVSFNRWIFFLKFLRWQPPEFSPYHRFSLTLSVPPALYHFSWQSQTHLLPPDNPLRLPGLFGLFQSIGRCAYNTVRPHHIPCHLYRNVALSQMHAVSVYRQCNIQSVIDDQRHFISICNIFDTECQFIKLSDVQSFFSTG